MRGAFFCITIDPADDVAGFIIDWIRTLAARLESLEVIVLEDHSADLKTPLPSNVRVLPLGKERGYRRPRLFANTQRALGQALGRADFLFCHMMPLYALVAAPLCRLRGKPLLLWYTHNNVDLKLRLAVRMADRVFTASPQTMNVVTAKKRVVGHGIDTDRFRPGPARPASGPLSVVSVGRLSPRKRIEILVEAAEHLKQQGELDRFRFILVGQEGTPAQRSYIQSIKDRIEASGLSGSFEFRGAVPNTRIVPVYQAADLFVSMQYETGLDKAVLEAAACGLPALAAHESYRPLLGGEAGGLFYPAGRADVLAERLLGLAGFTPDQRQALGLRLREKVVADYGLGRLMDQIIGQAAELVERRR